MFRMQLRPDLIQRSVDCERGVFTLPKVGTSRCDVSARVQRAERTWAGHTFGGFAFLRLTLRSATGTAQRAIPTTFSDASVVPMQRAVVDGDGGRALSACVVCGLCKPSLMPVVYFQCNDSLSYINS